MLRKIEPLVGLIVKLYASVYSLMETKNHRKVWESAHGRIPRDANNRAYEIHHINGDHNDNRLENLSCLTIEEHLIVHLIQGDWAAVAAITKRLGITTEAQRELNSLAGKTAYQRRQGWFNKTAEEHRKIAIKGGKAVAGYLWYNDGNQQRKFLNDPGSPWQRGRLKGIKYGYEKGRRLGQFWNNGKVNKVSLLYPGEGWIKGKLLSPEQRKRRSEIAKEVCKRRWEK